NNPDDNDDGVEVFRALPAATCLRRKTESSQGIPDPGLVITVDLSRQADLRTMSIIAAERGVLWPGGRSSQAGRDQLIVLLCVDEELGGVVASLEGAPEDPREEMIRE
ncbi:MAG: hypothetical protein ACLP1E_06495, partial [Acidimicrobiales bacterium]